MTHIVCLHAARGGSGTTHLTANIAARLAILGRRVAVVDANLYTPGIHLLLGLGASAIGPTLNDYLREHVPIENAAYAVTDYLAGLQGPDNDAISGSLHLVPASLRVDDVLNVCHEGFDLSALTAAFHLLSEQLRLDYLLFDTQAGLDPATMLLAVQADLLLIPLGPDAQKLAATSHMMDAIRRLREPAMHLIFNQVPDGISHSELRAQAEELYDIPTAALLPTAPELARLASKGLFALQHPGHLWSRGIDQIIDVIYNAPTVPL